MRIISIDFFRCLAVFAVILIHTKPFMFELFRDPSYRLVEYLFNQPPRFAVPFFFVTSGYFLAQKYARAAVQSTVCLGYVKRLLFLLVAWSLIYLILPSDWETLLKVGYLEHTASKLRPLLDSPWRLVLEGGRVHLWFLSSLICGVVLLTLFSQGGRILALVVFSSLLFAVGLLGSSYSLTPLGLHLPFYPRNGPFLSLICLTIGFLIYQKREQIRLTPGQAGMIAASGMALHVVETWALWAGLGVPMVAHDFLIGSVVCAAGLLLFALAAPDFGKGSGLHLPGQHTLGIYLSHLLFVDLLSPITFSFELHIWQFLLPFLSFLPAVPAAPVSPVLTRGWAQRFRKLFCNTALFCQGV